MFSSLEAPPLSPWPPPNVPVFFCRRFYPNRYTFALCVTSTFELLRYDSVKATAGRNATAMLSLPRPPDCAKETEEGPQAERTWIIMREDPHYQRVYCVSMSSTLHCVYVIIRCCAPPLFNAIAAHNVFKATTSRGEHIYPRIDCVGAAHGTLERVPRKFSNPQSRKPRI